MDRLQVKIMALALGVFNFFALVPAGYTLHYIWVNRMPLEFSSIMEMHQHDQNAWLLYLLPFLATGTAILFFRDLYYRISKLPN